MVDSMSPEFLFFAAIEIIAFILLYLLVRTKRILAERTSMLDAIKAKYTQSINIDEYKASLEHDLERLQKENQDQLMKNETDLEKSTKELLTKRESKLSELEKQKNKILEDQENKLFVLKQDMDQISTKYSETRTLFASLSKEVSLYQDEVDSISYGVYSPHFAFDTSEDYKIKLLTTRKESKSLISSGNAVNANINWTVNGSKTEGRKQTHYIKLMLRAFNGECDAMVADVRWNNIIKMEKRMRRTFQAINKLGTVHEISIRNQYLNLKLQELQLTFEYENKKHEEQEEQRRLREQIREEEKALIEAEEEQKRYQSALEYARMEMEKAKGEELLELQQQISELMGKLDEAQNQTQRALSMAQQTKSGNVYVISNIGSFGENVYKIGMTRRLDPQERVKELGDASVPFVFDVHPMIRSDNAPELETYLHNQLEKNRVNMVNPRNEFFAVTLHEIKELTKQKGMEIEFTKLAEAREYRESAEKRMEFSKSYTELILSDLDKYPVNL